MGRYLENWNRLGKISKEKLEMVLKPAMVLCKVKLPLTLHVKYFAAFPATWSVKAFTSSFLK